MATEISFTLCQSSCGKAVSFRELTGAYNASTNTDGWGSPNEATSDALTATLVFKDPNGVIYSSIDMTAYSFPKTDTVTATEILASVVDSSLSKFIDGFWNVTYTVTTSTTTYSQEQTFFFYANIKKELCALVATLNDCDCNCDFETVNRILQAQAFFDALQYAVKLGDTTSANEIFATLTNLINCTNC